MAIEQLNEEQIRTWSLEQKDRWWLENVYRGDMPQLTLRAAFTGFLLGGLLSATNLYIGAKTGWSLGVGVTSVILAFAFFKVLQRFGFTEFTILENNAMQSIATSAAYMTAPLISSLPAYMMVTGKLLPWWQIMCWNIVVSILGVLFAFPMKRKFINDEQHPFPEGQAAGVVMDALHSSDSSVGILKAKLLALVGFVAAFLKFCQAESIQKWVQAQLLGMSTWWRMREEFPLDSLGGSEPLRVGRATLTDLTVVPAFDLAMMGAGGLMGIRAGASLLIGATLNYLILAPIMIQSGAIVPGKSGAFGLRQITIWSLWPGVACIVAVSFVSFFAKPGELVKAVRGFFGKREKSDVLSHIEFPPVISLVGIPVFSLIAAGLGLLFFDIPMWVSLVGLPLTFVLCIVAAQSTALTSTTPVGATSKITQVFYGLVRPGQVDVNLATASITAEVVSNSSNLLMDIKPGYMLGAKPRQQAIGHVIGIISGALAGTFLFFVMFTAGVEPGNPDSLASLQSKQFPMPSVTIWKSIAEVLTQGLSTLPQSAKFATLVGLLVGGAMEVARIVTRNKFPLSPVALGLSFVIDFKTCLSMFAGAFFFWLIGVGRHKPESGTGNIVVENHEPICAGIIAGASLMGILDMLVGVFLLDPH